MRHSLRLCAENTDDAACKAAPTPSLAALHQDSCFALKPRPIPTCWLERVADSPGAGAAPAAASMRCWPPVICTKWMDRRVNQGTLVRMQCSRRFTQACSRGVRSSKGD